jgi:hydroxymethylpyrimidine/phosphomethylpyrimidine kinase
MPADRPTLLILSGFDPSGGAGMMADVRTAEVLGVHTIGCVTALTAQSARSFDDHHWVEWPWLEKQLLSVLPGAALDAVKVGMVRDTETLDRLLTLIASQIPSVPVVWDPVLAPSAGGEFHPDNLPGWRELLRRVALFTPNWPEMERLSPGENAMDAAKRAAAESGSAVLLKGGHDPLAHGTDRLFHRNQVQEFKPGRRDLAPKHGTGCVFSSAAAASLAAGMTVAAACRTAKVFTENFMASSSSLIGFHLPT